MQFHFLDVSTHKIKLYYASLKNIKTEQIVQNDVT